MLVFVGMLIGTVASGHLGDTMGRRLPICLGAALTSAAGLVTAFLPSFWLLLVVRFVLGMGIGFGFAPVMALMSEITPERHRIAVRSTGDALFDFGYTFAAFVATMWDPQLMDMQWRIVQLIATAPPALVSIFTLLFLQESPVYLAAKGEIEQARKSLQEIRRANGADVEVDFEPEVPRAPKGSGGPRLLDQLRVIFSGRYLPSLVVLCYTAFVMNMFYYGGIFAQPQVMGSAKKDGSMSPGVELIIGAGPVDMFGLVLVAVISRCCPAKRCCSSRWPSACWPALLSGSSGC